jgi:plastocyanin
MRTARQSRAERHLDVGRRRYRHPAQRNPHRSKHFKSSKTQERVTYTVTFNAPGTYDFECTIHPQTMQGTVIVSRP